MDEARHLDLRLDTHDELPRQRPGSSAPTRRLRIHCISIGVGSAMLKRIAGESGGEYVLTR